MTKAVIDTNVLVSALLKHGRLTWCVSPEVPAGYEAVLRRPKFSAIRLN